MFKTISPSNLISVFYYLWSRVSREALISLWRKMRAKCQTFNRQSGDKISKEKMFIYLSSFGALGTKAISTILTLKQRSQHEWNSEPNTQH